MVTKGQFISFFKNYYKSACFFEVQFGIKFFQPFIGANYALKPPWRSFAKV